MGFFVSKKQLWALLDDDIRWYISSLPFNGVNDDDDDVDDLSQAILSPIAKTHC